MNIQEYKTRFNNYYNNIHNAWSECDDEKLMTMPNGNEAKAIKDAVGKWYEKYRKELLEEIGFEVSEQEKFYGWNADQVLRVDGKIVAIESDKAQITTGLWSMIMDFIIIVDEMISEDKEDEIPYFILSSPTNVKKWESLMGKVNRMFNSSIVYNFNKKFVYLPSTNKGRIKRNEYIIKSENPFELVDENIRKELEFLNKIK